MMADDFVLSDERKKIIWSKMFKVEIKELIEKQDKEFIRRIIEEDLEACKVCGGAHGSWIKKDKLI